MAKKKSRKQAGSKKSGSKKKTSSKKAALKRSSVARKGAQKKTLKKKSGSRKKEGGGNVAWSGTTSYIEESYGIVRYDRDGDAGEGSGMRGDDPGPSISGGDEGSE